MSYLSRCPNQPLSSLSIQLILCHTDTHTGDMPLKFNMCPYYSAKRRHLIRHMKTHTGEKPFNCDKCPYSAARKCNLMCHLKTHTGD